MNEAPLVGVRRGFSLVEVILALGVISFCLLAILGIFSEGFRASMRANQDTVLAAVTSRVASQARALESFTFPATMQFDVRGVPTTNSKEAYYECEVTRTLLPETQLSGISTNLGLVKVRFTWPASIPAANRKNSQTYYATKS